MSVYVADMSERVDGEKFVAELWVHQEFVVHGVHGGHSRSLGKQRLNNGAYYVHKGGEFFPSTLSAAIAAKRNTVVLGCMNMRS